MSIFNSGKISRILSRIGIPASSTIAAKIDALHDTRLTSARAAKLDNCDASVAAVKATVDANLDAKVSDVRTPVVANLDAKVSAAIQKPPIEIVGVLAAARDDVFDLVDIWTDLISSTTASYDVWTDVASYTGSGILEFVGIAQSINANSRDIDARLQIDGVTVWSKTNGWISSADDGKGFVVIGIAAAQYELYANITFSGPTFGNVKFNSSFKLQFKKSENATGTITMKGAVRYQKWT